MTLPIPLFIISAFWSLITFFLEAPASTPAPVAQPAAQVNVSDSRTLEFVENKGQWPQQVVFAADIPSGKMFLQANGFVYSLRDPDTVPTHRHAQETSNPTLRSASQTEVTRNHAYAVTFAGANASPAFKGEEETGGIRNYFLGKDPKKWGAGAKGFRQVRYNSLYRGVDLALYEQNGLLKYDLFLAAGVSAAQIKMHYNGLSGLSLKDGNLRVETSVGEVLEHKPVAYQMIQNRRVPVPCIYELQGKQVSFGFPKGYDNRYALVIDPIVEFATFTGSTADNWGFTATYDSKGNMYSGGIASSIGYPVSLGAFDTSFNGSWDMAIIKYNTKTFGAAARLYATYIGGSSTDVPHSLVVNAADELLVLGTTGSVDYPTSATALFQTFKGGPLAAPLGGGGGIIYPEGSDLVITRLSPTGDELLASTYLGGTSNDGLLQLPVLNSPSLVQNYGDQFRGDIITDPDGNVYITSNTSSSDYPVQNGLNLKFNGGSHDAVVTKLSPNLGQLIWSNFYGGAGIDAAYSIQLDQNRQVYLCGGTTSPTLPGANGLRTTSAGNTDGFVLKLNSAGSSVLASTFLGTGAYDQTYFLQLDRDNSVYLLGQTLGNYPVTNGTYRNTGSRQFLHKLDNNLSTTAWSTVFGSGRNTIDISPTAFLVDECQRIYVSGWGGGSNNGPIYNNGNTQGLPTTQGAFQAVTDGGDFYLMQLGTDAKQLLYATYYGGNQNVTGGSFEHVDGGTSRFDKKGYVYQAVCGGCQSRSNFPIPLGANFFSRTNNSGNCNNAAFKFDFVEDLKADAGEDSTICAEAGALKLKGTPTGGVWSGEGVTLVNGQYIFTPSAALVGPRVLTYTVTGTGSCAIGNEKILTVTSPAPHAISVPPGPYCANSTVPLPLTGSPGGGTFSGTGVKDGSFVPAMAGVGRHTITYKSDGSNGLCGTITTTIDVIQPVVTIGPDTTLCPGSVQPFQLRASVAGGVWSGTNVSPTGMFTPPAGFTGTIDVTYSLSTPCPISASKKINLPPRPAMQAQLANSCPDNPEISGYAPFNAAFTNGTTNAVGFTWFFGDGTESTEKEPRHQYPTPGRYKVTLIVTYGSGCQETLEVGYVVVAPPFIPNIFTPNKDGKNETFVQHFSCLPTEIIVYNRWGKQVHQEQIYNQKWDGGNLSEGSYFYILKDTEGNTAKGWVEIIR